MDAFAIWMMLSLCTQHIPGDDELTMRNCQAVFEVKFREIEPDPNYRWKTYEAYLSE